MAFVRLAFFPGGTADQYAAVAGELAAAPSPSGRLVFAAGALKGGWQVVQVWERKEDLEAFNERWFLPAMRRLGGAGFPAPPSVQDFVSQDFWLAGTSAE